MQIPICITDRTVFPGNKDLSVLPIAICIAGRPLFPGNKDQSVLQDDNLSVLHDPPFNCLTVDKQRNDEEEAKIFIYGD